MVRIYIRGAIIAVDTKIFSRLYLTTVSDGDSLQRSVIAVSLQCLYVSDYSHALDNLAKHNMFPIKMRSVDSGDEELRSIGVGTSISHG